MNCDYKCKNVNTCCDKCYSDFLKWKKKNNITFYINKINECDHYYPRGNDGRLNECEFCGKEKEILSAESYFDEHSYTLGRKAEEDDINPFFKNTNSRYNWNKGKNEKFIDKILPIQNK